MCIQQVVRSTVQEPTQKAPEQVHHPKQQSSSKRGRKRKATTEEEPEQVHQLKGQSSNKRGRKKKATAEVGNYEKATNPNDPTNALALRAESSNAANNKKCIQQVEPEQVHQLKGQSSNKRGRKRKSSLSYPTEVPTQKEPEQVQQLKQQSSNKRGRKKKLSLSYATLIQEQQRLLSLKKIGKLRASRSELLSCHFHSDGKSLAIAGRDRKVVIWDLKRNVVDERLEGHAHHVTDIRFRPNSTVFATSSFDRTVMLWDADADTPKYPFRKLVGHADHVMSTDFHPKKMDLLSSCDSSDEIRLWDVNNGDCKLVFKGGSRQVRFQPRFGDLLASSTGNIINIFDVQTNSIVNKFQGHVNDIRYICWDFSGLYLASVSEDSARIWSVTTGNCLYELFSSGNKFQSCTFHPGYGQVLAIGSHEIVELWNPIYDNRTWPEQAHRGIISSLASARPTTIIASVSHDQKVKIWE